MVLSMNLEANVVIKCSWSMVFLVFNTVALGQ